MKTYIISEFLGGDRQKLLQQFFSATELTIVLVKLLFLNKTIWYKFMFQNIILKYDIYRVIKKSWFSVLEG